MAFEDGLGTEPSQQSGEDFTGSAYDIIARTVDLWIHKLGHYIILVGVIGAAYVTVSFILLNVLFGVVDTIIADPLTYIVNLFFFVPVSNFGLIIATLIFAVFAFVLNAIIQGAAIKFTLDEYGGPGGEIGPSFSYSFGRVVNFLFVQVIFSFLTAIVLAPGTALSAQAMIMIGEIDLLNPVFPPGSIELLMSAMAFFVLGGLFLIYFNVRFAPTLAVVIDTDLSAIDSLKRAWELTSGNFMHVFGSYILMAVVSAILGVALTFVLSAAFLTVALTTVVQTIITALLFSSLTLIFTVILYRDLNSRTQTTATSSLDDLRVTYED